MMFLMEDGASGCDNTMKIQMILNTSTNVHLLPGPRVCCSTSAARRPVGHTVAASHRGGKTGSEDGEDEGMNDAAAERAD